MNDLRDLIGIERPVAPQAGPQFFQDSGGLNDVVFVTLNEDFAVAGGNLRWDGAADLLQMLVLPTITH